MVVLAEERQMVCGRISVGLSSFVLDAVCLGSSASMGHSTRLGSGLSSVCLARLLGGLSVLNAISLGSSLSLREQARCGSGMSLFGTRASVEVCPLWKWDFSLTGVFWARVGQSLSAAAGLRTCQTLSSMDMGLFSSSLSSRSVMRLDRCGCRTCCQQCFNNSLCVDRVFFLG